MAKSKINMFDEAAEERKKEQSEITAKKLNITLSGALGIIIDSFDAKLLTAKEVSKCLDILQKAGRRISGELINKVRDYVLR